MRVVFQLLRSPTARRQAAHDFETGIASRHMADQMTATWFGYTAGVESAPVALPLSTLVPSWDRGPQFELLGNFLDTNGFRERFLVRRVIGGGTVATPRDH
jgi:hypothetical protein